jgi:hypothetical protein
VRLAVVAAPLFLAVALVVGGCGAGDVADVAGFHTTSIKAIYAPKRYCDEVKDEKPDEGLEAEVYYRVVCLKDQQWGTNLLRACRKNPKSVRQQYWTYNPGTEESGYVTCDNLEELGVL